MNQTTQPDDIVWNREHTERGVLTGSAIHCRLGNCPGLRLAVRWPDGKITRHCSEDLEVLVHGARRIN